MAANGVSWVEIFGFHGLGFLIKDWAALILRPPPGRGLHDACADSDNGRGRGYYSMADIGLSAFSLFFMQSDRSFPISVRSKKDAKHFQLPYSVRHGENSDGQCTSVRCSTRFIPRICNSSFDRVITTLRARGDMEEFERLGGRALIALDGTECFYSQELGCPQCRTRKR